MFRLCFILLTLSAPTAVLAQSQFATDKKAPPNPYRKAPPPKAQVKKHDLILITVQKRTQADVGTTLDSERNTEYSLLLDQFVKLSGGNLSPDLSPQPNVEVESEINTRSRGRTNRNDRIQARLTARVIDVLANGNVRLEAREERTINDERTIITLSGEAPAEAITAQKVLSSDRIADLRIIIRGEGPVSSRTGWTWAARVFDFIWPF